jgi:hypothetical protein
MPAIVVDGSGTESLANCPGGASIEMLASKAALCAALDIASKPGPEEFLREIASSANEAMVPGGADAARKVGLTRILGELTPFRPCAKIILKRGNRLTRRRETAESYDQTRRHSGANHSQIGREAGHGQGLDRISRQGRVARFRFAHAASLFKGGDPLASVYIR